MLNIEQPASRPTGTAILNLGFRPFFSGAALFAVVLMLAWVGLYSLGWQWQLALPAVTWHAHEMVFGYGMAVIAGFLSQFGTVKVALEATIARAVKERVDLVVDGVHVLPGKLDLSEAQKKAVVVPIMLAVTNAERLAHQLRRRGREQPERGDSRRRKHLEAIWNLQSYMLDQAEKDAIPVIANWRVRETVRRILEEVMARICERFPADPSALE